MGTARSMDRRSFLKGATVAGAAAAAAGTLGLAGCAPQDKETVAAASGDLVLDAEKFTNAKWNFEIPPEPVDESKIGNTVECEILVIGAGVGGLVTATSAVEEGADVVVIASSDGPVSRGGSNAAFNTRLTHELGPRLHPRGDRTHLPGDLRVEQLPPRPGEVVARLQRVRQRHELAHGQDGALRHLRRHREQPARRRHRLVGRRPAQNAERIPLLRRRGCPSGRRVAADRRRSADRGNPEGRRPGLFSTTAVQLDREGDNTGRVTGCVAKRDGEYTRYKATKGVVLATGDFSQDKDMVAKYCPMALPFGYGGVYDGSGLKLALWIGASWQKYTPNAPMLATMGDEVLPCRWWAEGALTTFPGLLVNKKGVRYSNENCTYWPTCPIRSACSPTDGAFLIWDENWVQDSAPGRATAWAASRATRRRSTTPSRRCSTPTPTGPPPTSTPASTPRWPRTP